MTAVTAALAITRRERVACVTLNRPQALNAFDNALGLELLETTRQLATDPAVRAVVVTGSGRAFCSGADLTAERELTPDGHQDLRRRLRERTNPMIVAIRTMPKPVIAAVNGPAVGVGCSLALACDLIFASSSAYFLLGFAKVGLGMDAGCSAFLPGRVGIARATELAMLGERLPAERALAWGLVNRVVDGAALVGEAMRVAAVLAAGATGSYGNIKRTLNAQVYPQLEAQLALEAELQQERAESADFAEGLAAFAAKRAPLFTGAPSATAVAAPARAHPHQPRSV